jgi:hypothetical protein
VTLSRRDFVKDVAAVPMLSASSISIESSRELVNDVHTSLNPTWVDRVVRPTSIIEIQNVIHECRRQNKVLSVSGSRHAAGGQQFAEGSTLLDMRGFNRVVGLDAATGIVQVESGIAWPELLRGYLALQTQQPLWGIRQKQGGADRMTLAGALSANAHGHCLGSPPIILDVEWIEIVTAEGKIERCDRKKNRELFTLAIGGYGLFGIITAVELRVARRNKLQRRVDKRTLAELLPLIEKRAKSGATYGYFQYSIDETSDEFMPTGVVTTCERWQQSPQSILKPKTSIRSCWQIFWSSHTSIAERHIASTPRWNLHAMAKSNGLICTNSVVIPQAAIRKSITEATRCCIPATF